MGDKSISELWNRFKTLVDEGKFTNMEGDEDWYTDKVNKKIGDEKNALRSTLLEMCDTEYGLNIVGLMIWHDPKKVGWNGPKNYGTAWLMMDWELEQRQMEANNG